MRDRILEELRRIEEKENVKIIMAIESGSSIGCKVDFGQKIAPPMLFDDLVKAELEDELRPELIRLLDLKKTLPEMGMAPKIQIMNDYIERVMPEIKTTAENMEDETSDWTALNELFLRVVK